MIKKLVYALLIMLCASPLLAATPETTSPSPALPPDAQQAFDRGLKAVQEQEWGLASRYFIDAQKAAPYESTVLYNLGLAYAKAGHELPAIAWLEAYLAVDPQVTNAGAVRTEIERLKNVTRGKMDTIFQTAIAAAKQLDGHEMDIALYGISIDQAKAGDVEGAMTTYKLRSTKEEASKISSQVWSWFSTQLLNDGDLERAQEAMKDVTEAKDQDEFWGDKFGKGIFYIMLEKGDMEAARNAAQKIHDAETKGKLLQKVRIAVLKKIINENASKGDFDFTPVEELLPLLENDWDRVRQLLSIAEQQGKFKDAEGKKQTINRALKLARQAQSPRDLAGFLTLIASGLFEQGDFSQAKDLAKEALACGQPELIKPQPNMSIISYENVVTAHAILGQVSEALALIRSVKPDQPYHPNPKNVGLAILASTQAMSGDLKGAKETEAVAAGIFDHLEKDDTEKELDYVQLFLAEAQLKKGDPAGALETLKQSREASTGFPKTCSNIFDGLMTQGDLGHANEVVKLMRPVAYSKENKFDHEEAAKEYIREMGLVQMHSSDQGSNSNHTGEWVALAIEVSTDDRVSDLEKALKDASEAKGQFAYAGNEAGDRVSHLATVAFLQGATLNRMAVLEKKAANKNIPAEPSPKKEGAK